MTILSYATAKRLKDAGWPQPDFDTMPVALTFERVVYPDNGVDEEQAYSPSLSELIDACKIRIEGKSVSVKIKMGSDHFGESWRYSAEIDTGEDLGPHYEVKAIDWKDSEVSVEEAVAELLLAHPEWIAARNNPQPR